MILRIMLVILFQNGVCEITNNHFKMEDNCHMYEVDFWKFYYWAFQNTTHLYLSTFSVDGNSEIIEEFLGELLRHVSFHALYEKSFTISRYSLEELFSFKTGCEEDIFVDSSDEKARKEMLLQKKKCYQLKFDDNFCEKDPLDDFNATLGEVLEMIKADKENDTSSQLQKRIRSFSADLHYRYILLVQDEQDFYKHLDEDWTKIFPNPRGIYVITFISRTPVPPESIEALFSKIWTSYGVLNLIIQQPCICSYKELYAYDPYYPTAPNSWGLVKKFRIEDALKDPSEYRRSLQKLNWHPLKVSLFNRLPTAVRFYPKTLKGTPIYSNLTLSLGFIGIDGMVLKTLCELLKLKPLMKSKERDYGYEIDGAFFGNLGEVVNRTLDASFNSRFVESVALDYIEYLTPVINDKFCIIVPKALEIPHYLMLFQCFTWRSWLIILFTYLFSSIYWYIVRPFDFQVPKDPSLTLSFLEVFCLFISIPIKLATSTNHRIFFVSCMIFNIIIIGTFQGTLTTSFSTTSYYPDINTLEEFDKSGLYILTASRGVQTVFGDDGSEFFKKMNKKIKIVDKLPQTFNRIAYQRDMASMERKADAVLKIKMNFTVDKAELVHIAKDCPRSYHFTYILPKGSPYVHVFNIIITVLREAGLLGKWNSDVVEASIAEVRWKNHVSSNSPEVFSIEDMKIAFTIHLIGNLMSIVAFLVEAIVGRKKIRMKCLKE